MNFFGSFIIGYILFLPIFFPGIDKFIHFFSFFTVSIFIFFYLYKKNISISFKTPLIFLFIFSFITIITAVPISNFIIKIFSPNLYKIISSFNLNKTFSLSLSPIWTLRNLSFIITGVSIFFLSFFYFENRKEKTYRFSKLLFLSIFLVSLYSLFIKFSNFKKLPLIPVQLNEWNFGLFPNANIFASFALLGIPLGFFLFLYKTRYQNKAPGSQLFYLFGSFALILAIILAQSWGALLSLLLSANICIFFRKPYVGIGFFLIIIIILYLIIPAIPPDIKRSMESRFSFYSLGINIFLKYFLFGTGLGTIPIASGIYQKPMKETIVDKIHNDYIELLSTSGIISIFLFLSLGIIIYKNFIFLKGKYNLRCGIFLGIVCVLVHSFMDFPLQNFTVMSYFSLALGVLFVNHDIKKEKRKNLKNIFLILLGFSVLFQFILITGLLNIKYKGYSYFFPEESFSFIRTDIEKANNFVKYFPFYAPIWGEQARLLEREDKVEEAINCIERAIILEPTNPKLYPIASKLYFIKGDDENYLKSLSYGFGLGNMSLKPFPLSDKEKERVVLKSLEIASKYYGKDAYPVYLKSYYVLFEIKSKKAKEVALEGTYKFKDSPDLHYLLAREYFNEGNLKGAEEENLKSFNLLKDLRNYLLFAKINFKRNNYEEGKRYLYDGINLIKPDTYTLGYFIEGADLLKQKSPEEAREFLKTGFYIKPYPLIAYYIGIIEEEVKNFISAEEWYKKSIEIDDKFESSYRRLYYIYKIQKDFKRLNELIEVAKLKFPQSKWYEE